MNAENVGGYPPHPGRDLYSPICEQKRFFGVRGRSPDVLSIQHSYFIFTWGCGGKAPTIS